MFFFYFYPRILHVEKQQLDTRFFGASVGQAADRGGRRRMARMPLQHGHNFFALLSMRSHASYCNPINRAAHGTASTPVFLMFLFCMSKRSWPTCTVRTQRCRNMCYFCRSRSLAHTQHQTSTTLVDPMAAAFHVATRCAVSCNMGQMPLNLRS